MAGAIYGSVDHVTTGLVSANCNQEIFTFIYNFVNDYLIATGLATMIATQYGNDGAAGTGFGYFNGVTPSRENAFFLFRMNTSAQRPGGGAAMGAYYVLVQWADTNAFGAAPGNPGKINNAAGNGVAICAAFREDGGSPWNGTTLNNGADTKGAPVWTAGGSTLHVLERSCSTGGVNAVNKENMIRVAEAGVDAARIHMIGDDDSLVFIVNPTITTVCYTFTYLGLYDPSANLTCSYPMCFISSTIPLSNDNIWGTLNGDSTNEGTIVSSDFQGDSDCMIKTDLYTSNLFNQKIKPNQQMSRAGYDEVDLPLLVNDTNLNIYGMVGKLTLLRSIYGSATETTNADMDRATFGTNVTTDEKISTPWGSSYPPAETSSRSGRQI